MKSLSLSSAYSPIAMPAFAAESYALNAPVPVQKISVKKSDLDLIDDDLKHLKLNVPVTMGTRDDIVREVFTIQNVSSQKPFCVDMNQLEQELAEFHQKEE